MRANLCQIFLLVCALGVLAILPISGQAAEPAATPAPKIAAECAADLAARLKVPVDRIILVQAQPTTWPDDALGMPAMGMMYTQALMPGWALVLEAGNMRYLYTTSATAFRYGGPVASWGLSLLYIEPIANEPNMNGILMQCSVLGTNGVRLATGVSDFYPQAGDAVLFTRRTSRSGFDLLYVNAKEPGKDRVLASAFAFGAAALNEKQDTWAAFVRPRVGGTWTVVTGPMGKGEAVTIALPEGVNTGEIAWEGTRVMILAPKGDGKVCYEYDTAAANATWKTAAYYSFPGTRDFVLNKSESLDIDQKTVDGKPVVEVASVWFNGDRRVIATVPGLTMRGCSLLGRYAVVWGEQAEKTAVYTVDIVTGEVLAGPREVRNLKPLAAPLAKNPLQALGKTE